MGKMPDIDWLRRWEEKKQAAEKTEIANMPPLDYEALLAEMEHR